MQCIGMAAVACIAVTLPAAAQQRPVDWEKMPRMQLERQFAGPLLDTIIQRWRDPVDGIVCYVYLPITAEHTPRTPSGYVQYGPNGIGSISCSMPADHAVHAVRQVQQPQPKKPASATQASATPPVSLQSASALDLRR